MAADEVVVAPAGQPSFPDLTVVLIDASTGLPVDLSGAATATLEGKSEDLSTVVINAAMTIVAPGTNGQVKYSGLGTLVTHAQLVAAGMKSALYRLRVHFKTAANKHGWGPEFELLFKDNPLGT